MKQTKKQRTEITIETHSLTIIKIRNVKSESVYCDRCGRNARVLTPHEAALIFRVSKDLLSQLSGSGQIHKVGENAVCSSSLADHFKQDVRFIED